MKKESAKSFVIIRVVISSSVFVQSRSSALIYFGQTKGATTRWLIFHFISEMPR